ncbi:hypothetical protein P691DRAFT_715119 [Macrolepiota fuliginosa MF-IS2]|uniref:F-box domain-containing protein n=1 Tax=Macrolepiota fuliginosa MF-IS2 TaxID=1400762 RepID=A0A9P5X255_9AGAR|nr:hypothetical protein P691DRAFT_715119 [Macrolepiota fuliginosa MF-IS2]
MNLLSLPTEILTSMCLYLGVADSYALQSVNRLFLSLYQTSVELQYALECQIACVDDNPRCHLPVATRLQILRDRETAWRLLKPTFRESILVPSTTSTHYDVTRSHYVLGLRSSSSIPFADGIQSYSIQTPIENSWSVVYTENLVDFGCCIDECDLVACLSSVVGHGSILELYLHLFQHSTGNPYPLATKPKILLCREKVPRLAHQIMATIEVVGETIVLAVEASASFRWMYVLNWKTGESRCDPISVSSPDLAVLSHDLFVNPNIDQNCLDIYYIPQSSHVEVARLIQRLRLPRLRQDMSVHSIRCRAAPNLTGDGKFPKYIPGSIPFMDKPENAIMLFRLDAGLGFDWSDLSMVVHRYSIMKLLPPPSDWSIISCQTHEWQEWGPSISSWIASDEILSGDITVSNGQRHVLHGLHAPRVVGETPAPLTIQNFNPYSVRRALADAGMQVRTKRVLEHPIFCEPITCRLPYVEVISDEEYPYRRVSITDNAIIGRKYRHPGPLAIDVLHFG